MTYLILQTAGIMLVAYVVGAFVGCFFRRMIYSGTSARPPVSNQEGEIDQPVIETATAAVSQENQLRDAERFEKALSAAPQSGDAQGTTSTAAVAAAAATVAAVTAGAAVAAADGDDLTRIKGVSSEAANHLNKLGFAKYADIAGWKTEQVKQVDVAFGEPGRVSRENWIEQAQVLAKGGETSFARAKAGRPDVDMWASIAGLGPVAEPQPEPPPPEPTGPVAVDAATPEARISVYGAGAAETPAGGSDSSTAAAASVAAAAAAAAVTAAAVAPSQPDEDTTIVATPVATAPSDDLARIRGIDAATQSMLNANGITSYAQIASLNTADVHRLDGALGGRPGRVSRENWIEQAQVLAKGGETAFVKSRDGREPFSSWTSTTSVATVAAAGVAAGGVAAAVTSIAPIQSASGEPSGDDDLGAIRAIDADTERVLAAQGVTSYAQIAGWKTDDIARIEQAIGGNGRVSQENWIEQAQVLAKGGTTEYARRRAEGQDVVAEPQEQLAPAPVAVAAAPQPAVADPVPASATEPADSSEAPRPAKLADAIKARQGASAGAAAGAAGLAGMRSVRSQALRGGAAASGSYDDLKRIRGVGVLIEKKLNSLGITSFDQIANWTSSDVDRISQLLDFKGRIERENWIEQARILSSGGQTEFSRRMERGEGENA